ncbi:M15 family metallopeptidase [Aquimarina muelleri]|uniref:D-alanyl-D-alanine carboxypeptidase n=1 Tax=Aquimarina muelleri TaxID=279356 RepID=A0A918JWV9_9FLAO|nr:M15 family metallopeptidase [Aquimarina muelleri]MCX2764401.1 M15 family metallopeptidase [Aquimarina muelleri]GGX21657.1 D-alanyl-D-alanine carboxypeptidase [Aquimarina muelleri]
MIRRNFIEISTLGLLGILTPSFSILQSKFSKNDLIGKSNTPLFGDSYKLRKEAYEAFLKMKVAASKSGFKIKVVSSYRSYAHQNRIWERKYKKFTTEGLSPIEAINKIIEYSTIPGTSRHHWGTDLDIVDGNAVQPKGLLLAKNFEENGPFCKFKEWMDANANTFGFFLVYTDKEDRKGFKYEPWHYSYAPLSIPMLKEYRKINITEELDKAKLLGNNYFTEKFIDQYIKNNILDINPELF